MNLVPMDRDRFLAMGTPEDVEGMIRRFQPSQDLKYVVLGSYVDDKKLPCLSVLYVGPTKDIILKGRTAYLPMPEYVPQALVGTIVNVVLLPVDVDPWVCLHKIEDDVRKSVKRYGLAQKMEKQHISVVK